VTQFSVEGLREWKSKAELAALAGIARTEPLSSPDRDTILALLKKHQPAAAAEFYFREGYEAVSAADPEHSYEVDVTSDGVSFTVRRRDGDPVSVSFDPVFDDTEEGLRKRKAFQDFLAVGTEAELDETNVPFNQLPESIRVHLREGGRPFALRIGPRRPRAFAVVLTFTRADGESYTFPYIELATNRFEGETVVLSNAQQKIWFKIEERLASDGRAEMSWSFEPKAVTAWRMREMLRFLAVMSEPSTLVVRDLDDGMEYVAGSIKVATSAAFGEGLPGFLDRLLSVQKRTGTSIHLPAGPIATRPDIAQLELIENILATGTRPPDTTVSITIKERPGCDELLEIVKSRPFDLSLPMQFELLLGNRIHLGPLHLRCESALVHPDDLQKVADLKSGAINPPQQVRIMPRDGSRFVITYPWWLPTSSESPPHPTNRPRA